MRFVSGSVANPLTTASLSALCAARILTAHRPRISVCMHVPLCPVPRCVFACVHAPSLCHCSATNVGYGSTNTPCGLYVGRASSAGKIDSPRSLGLVLQLCDELLLPGLEGCALRLDALIRPLAPLLG
mmetsp:Transcript_50789/g.101078  ORF Transcript_50789/g.101078 Transcript_50789/m.101078 type:complete len:128 (-) Transcript_50789:504-887(-)